jgi:putative DNA primase/helicase
VNILPSAQAAAGGCAQILRVQPENIPLQLRRVAQWLVWRIKPNGNKQPKKVPVSPKTGRVIDATSRRNLMGFDGAVSVYLTGRVDGVGFAFTPSDPFAGVDLDDCRNPVTGELDARAEAILGELDTYAEVSVSRTGVHAIALGALDRPLRRDGIELYDRARYFTFTGHRLAQARGTVEDREPILRAIQDRLRDPRRPKTAAAVTVGHGFDGQDADLLAVAFGARNGKTIEAYWKGHPQGKPSASEALLGLARLLAFYTGPDEARLERLVMQSPLFAVTEAERLKWTSARRGGTWGQVFVVRKAIESCPAFYQGCGRAPRAVGQYPSSVLCSLLNSPPTCVSTYAHPPGTSTERLEAICRILAQRRCDRRFFLSERTAADWLGVYHNAARKAILRLMKRGLIERTRIGTYRDRKNSAFIFRG